MSGYSAKISEIHLEKAKKVAESLFSSGLLAIKSIGAKYGDRSVGGARMCNRCIEVHHWHFWLQVKSLRL